MSFLQNASDLPTFATATDQRLRHYHDFVVRLPDSRPDLRLDPTNLYFDEFANVA